MKVLGQEAAKLAQSPRMRNRRWRDVAAALGVMVAVALMAQIPLLANHWFYYWDDTANTWMPTWYMLGQQLAAGHWPTLIPGLWRGGNLAAEVQYGIWNPVILGYALFIYKIGQLAVAAVIVKTQLLTLLALGAYLAAREYGARRGAAAAVAIALPFAGFTLYADSAAWLDCLLGITGTVHVLWSVRRCGRGALNPLVPIVIGYLALTTGSPYGALGTGVALIAVAAERAAVRDWRGLTRIAVTGAITFMSFAVVYLPLPLSAAVTNRSVGFKVVNTGDLTWDLTGVAAASAPLFQGVVGWWRHYAGFPQTDPVDYMGWFVLPLLPWVRWRRLSDGLRERVSLLVFGAVFLLLTLGPSNLWLFRWPLRLIEYVYLPAWLLIALAISAGLHRDRFSARACWSAALVAIGGYLGWAALPKSAGRQFAATALAAALVAVTIAVSYRRPRFVPAVLAAGTVAVLALQVAVIPGNFGQMPWNAPGNVPVQRAWFAGRYVGNTIQVADPPLTVRATSAPPPVRGVLLGSMPQAVGVKALNSYSGISFIPFAKATCQDVFWGRTCPQLYGRLWRPGPVRGVPLADLLRLQTVVVQNHYLPGRTSVRTPPPGWRITERTASVTVVRRIAPLAWPNGRLSWAAPSVRITTDQAGQESERIRYTGSGQVTLATLAWPGWQPTVDGSHVPLHMDRIGLVTLDLPPAPPTGAALALRFVPPGYGIGVPLFYTGLALGLGYGAAWTITRRRRRGEPRDAGGQPQVAVSKR
ncbi:MAG TPA: hypothetical protein VLW50_32340 [Streptosporangiaceae bacterium]|nr:hypothetical protein [Streptosporangiaceae bacterium]